MQHDTPLISMIVAGLVLAFILGAIANRLRMPPLVGYLVAGIVVGPYTPGFVGDTELASELSEIGVILLMFGVGLQFSLKDLVSVQALASSGAVLRMLGGTVMGVGLAVLLGWSVQAGLVFGLALSVASTVVLLKALQDRHLMDSDRGRIAVGWVIVEDIAMVLALVLIPALAAITGEYDATLDDPFVRSVERLFNIEVGIAGVVAVTVIKLAAFAGFMLIVGRRLIPLVLHFTAHTGSRELFRLAVLALALGVAAGSSYLFGVSLALGAFFAGMILSESELSHRAAEETLPLRDAFSVLFFVAVGMLFDPSILLRNPLPILATLFIILVGKSVIVFFIVRAFRRSVANALAVSASLAQIGEFSFILATLGVGVGILPPEGRDLILAGALVSILLNPVLFWAVDRMRPALETRFGHLEPEFGPRVEPELTGGVDAVAATEESHDPAHATELSGHTILIGYGRVGSVVAEGLLASGRPFVLIEDAEGRIAAARASGIEVIPGNAASSTVLANANVTEAQAMVIAIPNAFEAGQAAEQGRKANPGMRIVARSHSDEEEEHLRNLGADSVIMGEREIGQGLLERIDGDHAAAVEPAAPVAPVEPDAPAALAVPAEAPPQVEIEQRSERRPARQPAEPFESVPAAGGRSREAAAERAAPDVPELLPEPRL
ncbi:MAG TPA: YbaL family putative K(+) efflux transporter [Devosiaceae bacterium]|jgi:CPA2 family monovalent cation:H+ antiporter-2|nr:YbaL family putative K(+) efflux transporter [Devosiaceae bacterium]